MTERVASPSFTIRLLTADTVSHPRGAFRPSFALSIAPKERGRREGRVPAGTHGPPCESTRRKTAQRHTGEAKHTAFPARWSDGLCRDLPGAELSFWPPSPLRIDDAVCPVGLAHISAKGLTVATTARTTRFCRTLQRRSSARSFGLTGTTRPARASRARRCRVHRNPARVSNDSRTAPLRRAGLRGCMPQFRISVKWNIFAGRD
jgi:hypothetical protein